MISYVTASDRSSSSPTSRVMRSRAATVLTPVSLSTYSASDSGPLRMITTPRWMKIASSGLTRLRNGTASSVHMWYFMRLPLGVVTGRMTTLDPMYWSAISSVYSVSLT